jgi:hypothetical protein
MAARSESKPMAIPLDETLHEPAAYRSGYGRKHDRNHRGGLPGGLHLRSAVDEDDINVLFHKLAGERRQTVQIRICTASNYCEILPFDVTERTKL